MELARQSILIRELFDDYRKKNPVTDEAAKVEYDKFKAQSSGTEYRARHILVEKEDEAKALIAADQGRRQVRRPGQEELQGPGSAENGGDLDFAKPDSYVPEFSQAHGQAEEGRAHRAPGEEPVRLPHHQAGRHARSQFPAFDEVKGQIKQRMEQATMQRSRKNCAPRPRLQDRLQVHPEALPKLASRPKGRRQFRLPSKVSLPMES
jgi:peptidyl-prolyl cis-trans isomerase C